MKTHDNAAYALLTVPQAAQLTTLSEQAVRRLVRSGALPHVRVGERGGAIRIRRSALLAWLDGASAGDAA
ncbi:helix-turn-helix domain-containing protein [Microbacterium sp. No. 7]|uniref:helix-turn-helix domain-containing protein n=1 Tax=Microbacterium sp. No. 7 TaxID=1714373 RepID=UPI0006ED3131|nr:helix-turn-helix domain-containing protein [Microbacterium sp. No. 7]ALJ20646.1 hypothetical protein AOA12_12345 [Microbacterium sp. No. 7]